jgi:hypothetical protein
VLRVGGDGDQRPGPLGDSRTLADCCGPPGFAPAPAPSTPAAPPATTPPEERELLTIKQLVAYSALSERTLRGYIHRKVRPLPSYQVDKKIIVRKVEFDGWLASFRRADGRDGIDSMVEEILGGLTKPSTQANTRAQPKSLPASRRE